MYGSIYCTHVPGKREEGLSAEDKVSIPWKTGSVRCGREARKMQQALRATPYLACKKSLTCFTHLVPFWSNDV